MFAKDSDEAAEIAREIASKEPSDWGKTAILGRTRNILEPVLKALHENGVKAAIATRRDQFISPQFVWLESCLDQVLRPTDLQVFKAMTNAANRVAGTDFDPALLAVEAEANGNSYVEYWAASMKATRNPTAVRMADFALGIIQSRSKWKPLAREALAWLPSTVGEAQGVVTDAADDKAAWEIAERAITAEKGGDIDLAKLLQGLAIRPKAAPSDPSAVTLLTIHAAKGLEFDYVWMVGMAETVLPSWQSLKSDARPAELEEERRNCFVGITRTRQNLVLCPAREYRGWKKEPSRFLAEMGLAE